jgi:hypothetical protein
MVFLGNICVHILHKRDNDDDDEDDEDDNKTDKVKMQFITYERVEMSRIFLHVTSIILHCIRILGVCGSVVVKVLCY